MNSIDIIVLIPLLFGFYTGYTKGIFIQITGLISSIVALLIGFKLSGFIKEFLIANEFVHTAWGGVVGFIVAVVLIFIALKLIGKIAQKGTHWLGLGFFEKLLGAMFGLIKWGLITIILLFLFKKINDLLLIVPESTLNNSILYPYMVKGVQEIYGWANPMVT